MRINQIINETARDERFIQRLARGIAQFASNYAQQHGLPEYLEPGTIADVTGITGDNETEQYLTSLGVLFIEFPKNSPVHGALGAYRPAEGEYSADVGFNVLYLANSEQLKKRKKFRDIISMPGKDLASTATHELRHALDDYLSKGHFDKGKPQSYYDQPHEINARFSEVLHNLELRIKAGEVTRDTFLDIIKTELLQQKIKPTPRLIKRAYDYFAN